jgi:hypothetical protein
VRILKYAVSAVVIALLATPVATGAQTARDGTGLTKEVARKLSAAERRALDIDTMNLTASRFGLVVKITMKGDLTRRLGAKALARAAAGIVLTRRGGGSLGFGKVGIAERVKEFATDAVPLLGTAATTKGRVLTIYFGGYHAGAIRKVTASSWLSLPGAVNAHAAGDARVQVTPRVLALAPLADRLALPPTLPRESEECAVAASQIQSARDAQASSKAELEQIDSKPGGLDAAGRRRQEDLLHEIADLDTFIAAGDDYLMRRGC